MKLEERGKTVRLGAVAATVAVALTGAVGCKGTDNGSEGKPKVALVVINQQAVFFKELIRGAKKAAKDQGVDLTVFNANNDSAAQNTAIENYQQQNFDSIIVNPIDVEGIKPAISNASKAGSSIIAVDAIVDDPSVDTQVGIDNRKAGEQMGRYFTAFNKRAGRTGTSVGEVSALNSFVQVQRQKGFEQVVKKGGYKIAQVVDGKNVQEDALQASEDLITSQGSRMRSVYSTGEPALLGSVAAVKSQNASKRLTLFGWDLTKEAISGIDQGFVQAVVQQDPYTEGIKSVGAAKTLASDGKPPKQINVPITIVTKKNVDEYRNLFR